MYNRGKISDLFMLQFVYFASCKHLFYFHQFNIFYKLGPHSVHINKIKCISKMKYKDIQRRIINVFKKKIYPFCLSKVKVCLPAHYVKLKDIISNMEPVPTPQILSCDQNSQWSLHAFFMEDSAIHNTVMSLC